MGCRHHIIIILNIIRHDKFVCHAMACMHKIYIIILFIIIPLMCDEYNYYMRLLLAQSSQYEILSREIDLSLPCLSGLII